MKTYIENIESGVQIRFLDNDEDMKIFDQVSNDFDNNPNIIVGQKFTTFETPIHEYKYNGILFSLMFDEMCDETFIFIGKEYDYKAINELAQNI